MYGWWIPHGTEAFVKYNFFHKEQKRAFKDDIFRIENLYYNADGDYYVARWASTWKEPVPDTTGRKEDTGR